MRRKIEIASFVLLAALGVFLLGLFAGRQSQREIAVRSGLSAQSAGAGELPQEAAAAESRALGLADPAAPSPDVSYPLDLNSAGYDELLTLPGIGPSRAERILEYREACGGFRSVDELLQIDGIGTGILEDILDYVTVR